MTDTEDLTTTAKKLAVQDVVEPTLKLIQQLEGESDEFLQNWVLATGAEDQVNQRLKGQVLEHVFGNTSEGNRGASTVVPLIRTKLEEMKDQKNTNSFEKRLERAALQLTGLLVNVMRNVSIGKSITSVETIKTKLLVAQDTIKFLEDLVTAFRSAGIDIDIRGIKGLDDASIRLIAESNSRLNSLLTKTIRKAAHDDEGSGASTYMEGRLGTFLNEPEETGTGGLLALREILKISTENEAIQEDLKERRNDFYEAVKPGALSTSADGPDMIRCFDNANAKLAKARGGSTPAIDEISDGELVRKWKEMVENNLTCQKAIILLTQAREEKGDRSELTFVELENGLRAAARAFQTRTATVNRIRMLQAPDEDIEERHVRKVAEERGNPRRRKKGDNQAGGGGKVCSFCKKKGHSSDDCYLQAALKTDLGRQPTDKDREEAQTKHKTYVTEMKQKNERGLPIATKDGTGYFPAGNPEREKSESEPKFNFPKNNNGSRKVNHITSTSEIDMVFPRPVDSLANLESPFLADDRRNEKRVHMIADDKKEGSVPALPDATLAERAQCGPVLVHLFAAPLNEAVEGGRTSPQAVVQCIRKHGFKAEAFTIHDDRGKESNLERLQKLLKDNPQTSILVTFPCTNWNAFARYPNRGEKTNRRREEDLRLLYPVLQILAEAMANEGSDQIIMLEHPIGSDLSDQLGMKDFLGAIGSAARPIKKINLASCSKVSGDIKKKPRELTCNLTTKEIVEAGLLGSRIACCGSERHEEHVSGRHSSSTAHFTTKLANNFAGIFIQHTLDQLRKGVPLTSFAISQASTSEGLALIDSGTCSTIMSERFVIILASYPKRIALKGYGGAITELNINDVCVVVRARNGQQFLVILHGVAVSHDDTSIIDPYELRVAGNCTIEDRAGDANVALDSDGKPLYLITQGDNFNVRLVFGKKCSGLHLPIRKPTEGDIKCLPRVILNSPDCIWSRSQMEGIYTPDDKKLHCVNALGHLKNLDGKEGKTAEEERLLLNIENIDGLAAENEELFPHVYHVDRRYYRSAPEPGAPTDGDRI